MTYARSRLWLVVSITLLLPIAQLRSQNVLPSPFRLNDQPVDQHPHVRPSVVWTASRSTLVRAGTPIPQFITVRDTVARRSLFRRYALWGAGIGSGVGLAAGWYSMRYNNGCADCFTPDAAIPLTGAVLGSAFGFLVGSVVYLAAGAPTVPER